VGHRVVKVNLAKGEQKSEAFLKLNPAGAIPVIVDHQGPGGKPLTLAQSGAIVVYACAKAAKFIPTQGVRRALAAQWFMAAASDIACASGSMFQADNSLPDKSAANTEFFRSRLIRYFRNVDRHLAGRDYLADEMSFADLMLYPNYAQRKALIETEGVDGQSEALGRTHGSATRSAEGHAGLKRAAAQSASSASTGA
jgi:GST-like protein